MSRHTLTQPSAAPLVLAQPLARRCCAVVAHAVGLMLALLLAAAVLHPAPARAQGVVIDVTVTPVPTTSGALGLRRISLAFLDGSLDASVPLGASLGVRATFDYLGTGLLSGRFLVDGRPVQEFNELLTFGATKVIELAKTPGLPTFEPGLHEVTLQLGSPAFGTAMPLIRYTVSTATGPGGGAITLLEPAAGMAAALTATVKDASGLNFLWTQDGAAAPAYQVEVYPAKPGGEVATKLPRWTAQVNGTSWRLTTAASPSPKGQLGVHVWRVKALDASGAVTATSADAAFTLVQEQAWPIEIMSPVDGARTGNVEPIKIVFRTGLQAPRYEARAYRNDAALEEDLRLLGLGQGALAVDQTKKADPLAGAGTYNKPPAGTAAGPAAPALAAPSRVGDNMAGLVAKGTRDAFVVGRVYRVVVVAFDATAHVIGRSNVITIILGAAPTGMPTVLDFAAQEVDGVLPAPGATLAAFAGDGKLQFRRDAGRRGVPLSFSDLVLDTPYVERQRIVTGTGYAETVTLKERVKALVTRGEVAQKVVPPAPLEIPSFPMRVSVVELRAGYVSGVVAGPGAWADLEVDLPAYVKTAAGSGYVVTAPHTRLGVRGDFLRELSGMDLAPFVLDERARGPLLPTAPGRMVLDFSAAADAAGADGQPVAGDGVVYLADARLDLPASVLFPTLDSSALHLRALRAFLGPDALTAALDLVECDELRPVTPGGYVLQFTEGALALDLGELLDASVSLDGRVMLPPSVRRPGVGSVMVPFTGLKVGQGGGSLEVALDAGEVEWGASGEPIAPTPAATPTTANPTAATTSAATTPAPTATPTTVMTAAATSRIGGGAVAAGRVGGVVGSAPPISTLPVAPGPGLAIVRPPAIDVGTSDTPGGTPPAPRPFRIVGAKGTLVLPYLRRPLGSAIPGLALSAGTLTSPLIPDEDQPALPLPADQVALRIEAAGPSGTISWRPLGAATAGGRLGAGTVSKGGARRPRLAVAGDFRTTVTGLEVAFSAGAVTSSSVSGALLVPPPADFSLDFKQARLTATGELVGPVVTLPQSLPLPGWRMVAAPARLELSRSFVRLTGGSLQLVVDAAYGGDELGPLDLLHLDVGADGKALAVKTDVSTTFLGLPFTLDSDAALSLSLGASAPAAPSRSGESAPPPLSTLASLKGKLTFPQVGEKGATLEHTAKGAAVTLDDSTYAKGPADKLHIDATLAYVNGYLQEKGWKAFLGTARITILKSAQLDGLAEIGMDGAGGYERYGVGLSADVDKVASLAGPKGWLSVGVQLGQGAVAVAANQDKVVGGKEVEALITLAAKVASGEFKSAAARDEALFQALAAAVRIAKVIHVGQAGPTVKAEGDELSLSLDLAAAALDLASQLAAKKVALDSDKALAMALGALDASFPLLEKSNLAGGKIEVKVALEALRVVVKGAKLATEKGGKLEEKDYLKLARGVIALAPDLSKDETVILASNLLLAVVDVALEEDGSDPLVMAKIGAGILKAVKGPAGQASREVRNGLALAQVLLDETVASSAVPSPDRWIRVAGKVLDTAAGAGMDYGPPADGGDKARLVFRMAARLLKAYGASTGGIPQDQAALTVQDAFDTANQATNVESTYGVGAYDATRRLIGVWRSLGSGAVSDRATELKLLICEQGYDASCASAASVETQLRARLAAAQGATAVEPFTRAMRELAYVTDWIRTRAGGTATSDPLLDAARPILDPAIAGLKAQAVALVTSAVLPAIAACASPAECARAVEPARKLKDAAWRIDYQLHGSANPDPAYDWAADVEDPAVAALKARVTGGLKDELLAKLQAATEPDDIADLRIRWEELSRGADIGDDSPEAVSMKAALKTAAKLLVDTCTVKGFQSGIFDYGPVSRCIAAMHRMQVGAFLTFDEVMLVNLANMVGTIKDLEAVSKSTTTADLDKLVGGVLVLSQLRDMWTMVSGLTQALPNSSSPAFGSVETPLRPVDLMLSGAKIDAAMIGGWLDAAAADRKINGWSVGSQFLVAVAKGALDKGIPGPADVQARLKAEQVPDILVNEILRRLNDALDISTLPAAHVATIANRLDIFSRQPGQSGWQAILDGKVAGWIAAAKQTPCAKRWDMASWFANVLPYVPSKRQQIADAMKAVHVGCALPTFDAEAEAKRVADASKSLVKEVDALLAGTLVEDDKRAAMGWLIAAQINAITDGYTGSRPEERVMRATHKAVARAIQYKAAPRTERVKAVAALVEESIGDLIPGSNGAAGLVGDAVAATLVSFIASGEQEKPWALTLTLVASIANQLVERAPVLKPAVGAWTGLLAKAKEDGPTVQNVSLTLVLPAVAGGVGVAMLTGVKVKALGNQSLVDYAASTLKMKEGQVDVEATLAALGADRWGNFWKFVGKNSQFVQDTVAAAPGALNLVQKLASGLGTKSTADRQKLVADAIAASKDLKTFGPFVLAFLEPEKHLLAPDPDLHDWVANATLAEMGVARQTVPGSSAIPDGGACGLKPVGVDAQAGARIICALDTGRALARGLMAQAISLTASPAAVMSAQAMAAVQQTRTKATFGSLVGKNYSGLAGGLEYRGGALTKASLFGTLSLVDVVELAASADYDAPQERLRIAYAVADPRPPGLLQTLGLLPAPNSLLRSQFLQDPIKVLTLSIDGRSSCLDGAMKLALRTPLGDSETAEATAHACWNPVSLDFQGAIAKQLFPPLNSRARAALCGNAQRAGLDIGANLDFAVPLFPWDDKPYGRQVTYWTSMGGNVGLFAGFTADTAGLQVRAGAGAQLGLTVTSRPEPDCLDKNQLFGLLFPGTRFDKVDGWTVPDRRPEQVVAFGTCSAIYEAALDLRIEGLGVGAGVIKGQTKVSAGVGSVSAFLYKNGDDFRYGPTDFPSDLSGGWPTSASALGPFTTTCGGAP